MIGTGWKCDVCAATAVTERAGVFQGAPMPDPWLCMHDNAVQLVFCSRSCASTWLDAPPVPADAEAAGS